MVDIFTQKSRHKTPTDAKVLCVCGNIINVPIQVQKDVRCKCGTILWVEATEYDRYFDVLYIRPVAKIPKNFIRTILPDTPSFYKPEWNYMVE